MTSTEIIKYLPYQEPFLFVDEIDELNENGVTGSYKFREDAYFYKGHFKDNPVTPGVIITEVMAQIGVVCLGVFLIKLDELASHPRIALTSHSVDFYIPVFPGETVRVISEKQYFRFNKLKCSVKALNSHGELVARGEIAGMLTK